jgi:hypothetical protein
MRNDRDAEVRGNSMVPGPEQPNDDNASPHYEFSFP